MPHAEYGPLASFIGIWEGDKGEAIAPGPQLEKKKNHYKETTDLNL